jgi:hypothetical protein
MSTDLRNVPNCEAQFELTQTRFWGGKDRLACVQVTQRRRHQDDLGPGDKFFNHIQLTKHQARMLATELMLFAEGREVTDLDEFINSELEDK